MTRRWIVALFLGLVLLGAETSGTLGGTVAVVSLPGRQFAGAVAKATVLVTSGGKEVKVAADDNGDFLVSLPPGKYHLVRVVDEKSRDLRIDGKQVRVFTVRKKRHTRFDVLVELEPKAR
jgi:hypothetical protein